uniref:Uncharacterized protein n=1 Tax=Anopheles epiroticus TaxID=199890 RepID=A0A182P5U4_9DIPT
MPSSKSKLKPRVQFKVSDTKFSQAMRTLRKRLEFKPNQATFPSCSVSIIKQLNTNVYVQPTEWRQNWLEVLQSDIARHNWESFIRSLRVASQSHRLCGLENILRNSFLSILTHPIFKDLKTLRLFLYTVAPCRNENDIEYCIETILKTFNGDTKSNITKLTEKTTEDATNTKVQNS